MATVVQLPRLSDTMEEGVIAKWHIAPGDKVKRGQLIAEIETDKATMEFESFDAGTVLELVAPEGKTLPIGAPIAVIGSPGEDAKVALRAETGGPAVAPTPPHVPVSVGAPTPAQAPPLAMRSPAVDPSPVAHPATAMRDDGRIPASPLARRLAREHDLPLSEITGSGPRGRVIKTDVELVIAGRGPAAAASAAVDTPLQLSQMRKAIARRMSQANAEIPHFYLTIAINMGRAIALRDELAQAEIKISYNDLVVMGCARALRQHPELNAYWNGETIVRRGTVAIGVAVAVDDGLVVPVVRNADAIGLREIAVAVKDLGTRARERRLAPPEMTGSTFTVSNLGMFGVEEFSAVVNPGEAAILAVGAITQDAVVEDGKLAVGHRMRVTLSCDHRVTDGASGARFLATLRGLLEHPLRLLA